MSNRHTEFKILFWITQAVGVASLVLLCVWVFAFRGGVAWNSQPKLQFNWHVLTMAFAMVYFCALELMTFRALRYGQKKQLKLIHTAFAVPILLLLVIGYWSILDNHNYQNKPNWYSLHSWLGIFTTLLYLSQGIIGFVSFLWPGIEESLRRIYLPFHQFLGLTTFVMGVVTTLLGLFEEMKHISGYSLLSGEAVMMNLCGLLITVFTILVVFLQTQPCYQRQPLPTD